MIAISKLSEQSDGKPRDPASGTYQLRDTQGEDDQRRIDINKVGVRELKLPLTIRDRDKGTQQVTATADLGVDLGADKRGAHMSRFIELTEEYRQSTFDVESVHQFLRDTQERLESSNAYVEFRFDYFLEKESPLSRKKGTMDFQCGMGGMIEGDRITNWIVAQVPITTLCPCSKINSQDGAHNQRALVKSKVVLEDLVWLEELIEMIEEEGSSQLYSILKREDEAYVTDEAYDNPKFVEDIVRDLSLKFEEDERMRDFFLECISYESIHNHNAYARVVEGDLWQGERAWI